MKPKNILTISDLSCVGKCALTVSLPILSAANMIVSVLPTAVLSAHTAFEGAVITPMTNEMEAYLSHWRSLDLEFDAICTGYLAEKEQVDIISKVFDQYPNAIKIVDPVMGDNGRLYRGFDKDYPRLLAGLCARADVILPNLTEACLLTAREMEAYDPSNLEAIGQDLLALGAKNAIITGIALGKGQTGAAVFTNEGMELIGSPRIEGLYHGTGDTFAAVFAACYMGGDSMAKAAHKACDFVSAAVEMTAGMKDTRYGLCFEPLLKLMD